MNNKAGMKWGVYLGITLIVMTQILTWFGLGTTNWFVILTYLLVTICIVLFMREVASKQEEPIKYREILLLLVIMIITSRFLFQMYMYAYITYVDPSWIDTVSETWSTTMRDQGATPESIQNQIAAFRKAYEPLSMFTVELAIYAVPQLILGCIVAAIYKYS